jgi:hypothetical protein
MHKLKLGRNVLQKGRMQDLDPQKVGLAESKTFVTRNSLHTNCAENVLIFVLNGRETSSRTLREENRLRVLKNRVRRKISELKRDEITGECR